MSTLRNYQERDINSIEAAFTQYNSVLYQLPTGGGKSVVISQHVINHKEEKILILAHRRRLLLQMRERLQKLGLKVGLLVAEIEDQLDANIIIASIKTVARDKRIGTILDKNFTRVIVDEAHHSRIPSYEKVFDALIAQNQELKLFGVTATPYRSDKLTLEKYYKELICSDDVATLIANKYLSEYKVFYTPVGEIDEEVEMVGNEYQVTSLSNYMRKEKFLNYLVESYKREALGRQTLIFCVDRKHAKDVMETYIKHGFTSIAYIDSEVSEADREQILQDYQDKKIQFIVCIETLTEGVDLPDTGCVQLARPTKSLVLFLQMIGRGTRPKSDGSNLIILDCAGNTVEHGSPSAPKHWSLNPEIHPSNPSKKNKIVGKRKDGTFTENDEEMEFCELVEMTPEEYLMNVSGNIDSAKNHNQQVEDEIQRLKLSIGQLFITRLKLSADFVAIKPEWRGIFEIRQKVGEKDGKTKYNDNSLNFKREDGNPKTFTYLKPSLDSDGRYHSNGFTRETYFEIARWEVLRGKCYELILDKAFSKQIADIFEEIDDLQDSLININELKGKLDSFKEQQWLKKVEEHLKTNLVFELPKKRRIRDYFRDVWYGDFDRIVFTKNKLNVYNDAKLLNGEQQVQWKSTNQNFTKEKCIQILKDAKWGEEIKQEVEID